MSIKGSFPDFPLRSLPSPGLGEIFTPLLPLWPGRQTGILPSHQQEGTESGDLLRLANQFLLAPGQPLIPLVHWEPPCP